MSNTPDQPDPDWLSAYQDTHTRLQTIVDAQRMCERARAHNPDDAEIRALDARAAELAEERARCNAELTALVAGNAVVAPPSADERAAIAELSAEVEAQANSAVATSQALVLVGRVLETVRAAAARSGAV